MRILAVCRKMDGVAGGVERALTTMANGLAARGHSVHLLTWDQADARAYYPVAADIQWHKLAMGDADRPAGTGLRLRRMRAIRGLVSRIAPDVVVCYQHGPFLTLALSLLGTGVPVVAAERNAPERFDHLRAGSRRAAIFQTFRLARLMTVQMPGYRDGYPRYLRDRIRVVPNPVFATEARAEPVGPADGRTLLSVGRLGYQKNPGCLLRAFARIAERHPDWRLRFVGDGEERDTLERAAHDLGIAGRVVFAGTTERIDAEYAAAQLFCLASRWEGFPNAIAEALAHGLPTVAFAECAGANVLIRPEENGLLAAGNDDVDSLAEMLSRAMASDGLRTRLAENAPGSVAEYRPDSVMAAWEAVFREAAAR